MCQLSICTFVVLPTFLTVLGQKETFELVNEPLPELPGGSDHEVMALNLL